MKGIFENRKEFDMKLVKVNRNEVLKERSLCAAALSRSIKNYNLHGIMCIQRKNNVYLIRIEDEKED